MRQKTNILSSFSRLHLGGLVVLLSIMSCQNATPPPPPPLPPSAVPVSSGTVVRLDSFPSNFVTPRNVDVWLPNGYNPAETYPVLIMHDGQMLFDSTSTWNGQEWAADETLGKLIADGTIPPCILVGVWNAGPERHPDYFPEKPFKTLPQHFRDSIFEEAITAYGAIPRERLVQSDRYLKFLVQELLPHIRTTYNGKTGPEHTFIAGSSMGGLISMYAFCEYPDVFGGAACLSTHWIGVAPREDNPVPAAFIQYLQENLPASGANRIYFDYGTATLDQYYEPHQLAVDSVMQAAGYTAKNWMTQKFEGAPHTENAWRERLHIPLTFIMGNNP